jgi:hypothetical protein
MGGKLSWLHELAHQQKLVDNNIVSARESGV